MHLAPQKRKKKFCLGMGTLKLIYHLLLLRGLKPVTVRPAKRVWMFQVLDIPKNVLNAIGRLLGNLPFLVCPMMKDQNDDQKPSESEGIPVGHDIAHVPDMEVDGPEYMDTEVAMTSRNMKRESDVPLENLEEEIRRETETDRQKVSHVLSSMVSAAFGVSDYVPLSDMLVDSVQFAAE